MMDDIDIRVEPSGGVGDVDVVHVKGLIDSNTSNHLGRVLSDLISRRRYKLVIDLQDVDYISSAGWGIFIGEIKTVQNQGGDLKLASLTPDVEEVYKLLEFYSILKAYDSVTDAMKDFR